MVSENDEDSLPAATDVTTSVPSTSQISHCHPLACTSVSEFKDESIHKMKTRSMFQKYFYF